MKEFLIRNWGALFLIIVSASVLLTSGPECNVKLSITSTTMPS